MNPQNRNKIIILGVLLAAAAFFVLKPLFTESEFDRKYRENMAKGPQPAAASGAAPVAPAAGAAAGAAVKSQFQKASVNVDQLISSVQEISFDYDTERMQTDPMTPLVGPSAHVAATATSGQGDTPGSLVSLAGDSQSVLRTFRVTGILWDKRDPMAVVSYPVKGQLTSEVVTRGFTFPDTKLTVIDIEQERVVLDADGTQVSLQLEER